MSFKKKFKTPAKIASIGAIALGLGLTTLVQPVVLGQNHIVKAEDSGLTSTAPAGESYARKIRIRYKTGYFCW